MIKCSVLECIAPARAKGMCAKHYMKQKKYGDPNKVVRISYEGVTCSVDNCDRRATTKGMCPRHFVLFRTTGRTYPIGRKSPELRGSQYRIADETSVAISLTRGYEAIIDMDDIDLVAKHNWHSVVDFPWINGKARVRAQGRINGIDMYLHQFIMGFEEGKEVDHEDKDSLNCRRSNMQLVTHQENCYFRTNR